MERRGNLHIVFLLLGESQNIKGLIGKLHVFTVVDGGHRDLALGHVPVVHDVVGQQALLFQVLHLVRPVGQEW